MHSIHLIEQIIFIFKKKTQKKEAIYYFCQKSLLSRVGPKMVSWRINNVVFF